MFVRIHITQVTTTHLIAQPRADNRDGLMIDIICMRFANQHLLRDGNAILPQPTQVVTCSEEDEAGVRNDSGGRCFYWCCSGVTDCCC